MRLYELPDSVCMVTGHGQRCWQAVPRFWPAVMAMMVTVTCGNAATHDTFSLHLHTTGAAPPITWFKSRNGTELTRDVNGSIEWGAISKPGSRAPQPPRTCVR
jgi:hypothetical protein